MIFLDPNSLKVKKAKKAFNKQALDYISEPISEIVTGSDVQLKKLFGIYILFNLNSLIIGDPNELDRLEKLISPVIIANPKFKEKLKEVFITKGYKKFSKKNTNKKKIKYDAYSLSKDLDMDTCTYCNRNYTNTIISRGGKKLSRPQFDHFIDKKSNPQFGLSFFNLIPSCSVCNTNIKTTKEFNLTSHVHPYLDNKIDKYLFNYKYCNQSKNGLRITVKDNNDNRVRKTIKDFAMEEVYNGNSDLMYDLLKIRSAFSDRYLSSIETSLLKDITVSRDELYRLAFGTEMKEENFHKRPFSKFKFDLLKELGILDS